MNVKGFNKAKLIPILTVVLLIAISTASFAAARVLMQTNPGITISEIEFSDYDSDGVGETVAAGPDRRIYLFENNGSLIYTSDQVDGDFNSLISAPPSLGSPHMGIIVSSTRLAGFNINQKVPSPLWTVAVPAGWTFEGGFGYGDINGDGLYEFITSRFRADKNYLRVSLVRVLQGTKLYETGTLSGRTDCAALLRLRPGIYDDLVFSSSTPRFYIYRYNPATGAIAQAVSLASTTQYKFLLPVNDINGDGVKEIACIGFGASPNNVIDIRNGSTGAILASAAPSGQADPLSAEVSDIDGDGIDEIIVSTGNPEYKVKVFKAQTGIPLIWSSSNLGSDSFVRVRDFDYDGSIDIVYSSNSNLTLIDKNFNAVETTNTISGLIDSNEKIKVHQYNGGAADVILFANNTSTQLKAITFYTPPVPRVRAVNRQVTNTNVSANNNFLLDRLYLHANYDGELQSIRYHYSGTLSTVYISALKLYLDNGNGNFDPNVDTLLAETTVQSDYAVFNFSRLLNSDTTYTLFLAGDFRSDIPGGYQFKFSIIDPADILMPNFETTGTFPIETPTFNTVDITQPLVFYELIPDEPDGENGWYKSMPNLRLFSNKLGVIYYRWNEDDFHVYLTDVKPPVGDNTIQFYAQDLYGNRSTTTTLNIKFDLTPPELVRDLRAEETAPGQVTLVWKPSLDKEPGSGLNRYEIWRNEKLIATVSSANTSYVDMDVKPLSRYRYKVRAVDTAGNRGAFSHTATVKTSAFPITPPNVNVISREDENVIVWSGITSTEVAAVDVYRSMPRRAARFEKISETTVSPDEGIFIDSEVNGGSKYYYLLKLLNINSETIYETTPVSSSIVNIQSYVDSSAKTISDVENSFKLEIPAGSVMTPTTITVESTSISEPAGTTKLSNIYSFGPSGFSFSIPATLTISFIYNNQIASDLVYVGVYDGSKWELERPDYISTQTAQVSKLLGHFSAYGVFYYGTGVDTEPPKISAVRSASPSKLFVTFNEFIDTDDLSAVQFEVSDSTVTTFYPFKDEKSIVVETMYLEPGSTHELYVYGIKDKAGNVIEPDGVSNYSQFTIASAPHGRYLDDTNKCSLCHSVHYGKTEQLLVKENARQVCYICHDAVPGMGSKYQIQLVFENPDNQSIHYSRVGDSEIYCTDCHSPHRDPAQMPGLLRILAENTTETTQLGDRFCFSCHNLENNELPVYRRISETSYSVSAHGMYLPGSSLGTGITCVQCHLPHASTQKSLLRGGAKEFACITCHKKNGISPESGVPLEAPDVLSALLNAPAATQGVPGFEPTLTVWYKHPIIEYYGRHDIRELYDATLAASSQATPDVRHAECEDCHNSHYAKPSIYRNPPYLPDSMYGAAGVGISYPYGTTEPVFTWLGPFATVFEYQVCLRCHSSFAASWLREDLAKVMSPNNGSYHPVLSIGKNDTTAIANSLIALTPQSQIYCTDCHFQADPTYARGTHGSIYPFILADDYRLELKPQSTTDDYDPNDFALCYRCHSKEPFEDATGVERSDTNFRWHGVHLRALYNNPRGNTVDGGILTPGAGKGNAICRECHYNQHGSENSRLVKFSPNVLPTGANTEPIFVPRTTPRTGYCLLRCHGRGHGTGMNY